MQRKSFIKLSSAIMATPFLSSIPAFAKQEKLQNWAGNLTYSTNNVFYPKTVSEVQSLVKKCEHLRGLGTRHCFNSIADSKYNLISSSNLNNILSIDSVSKTVTVEAGVKVHRSLAHGGKDSPCKPGSFAYFCWLAHNNCQPLSGVNGNRPRPFRPWNKVTTI
jgi:hypothetical protein